jgi:hypothetical protein
VAAAAVRRGAVARALPRAKVPEQLHAVAEALHGEAMVVASLRRAAEVEVEVELPRRAVAAEVESPRRAGVAYAPRWSEACSQEALKRCQTTDSRYCYP